jgi:transposase
MLMLHSGVRIFVATKPADLRKGFDSLAGMVRQALGEDPLSGSLFVFANKSRARIKILFFDRTGFVLWHKRLETGLFQFPSSDAPSLPVEAAQLALLLDGIALGGARPRAMNF